MEHAHYAQATPQQDFIVLDATPATLEQAPVAPRGSLAPMARSQTVVGSTKVHVR